MADIGGSSRVNTSKVDEEIVMGFDNEIMIKEQLVNLHFCPALQLVTVLDLASIRLDFFPRQILQLVHLRYLALWAHDGSLPASISNLRNLQTLIVSSERDISVPQNFWEIVTLRHFYIKSGINVIEYPCFGDPAIGDDSPSLMADIGGSSRVNTSKVDEEIIVGFDNEIMMIKEQLTRGKKQREVISIIGMAGLGKTTLARKVYDDPLIVYHFYIRAWAYVSQVYRKRDLLLGILSYVIELTDEMHEMSDEELSLKLKKGLMGRRYLIVMDDIWSVDAWDCLKRSFPDDNNGSRIMFTSRLKDVALHAQPDSHLHCLRFLTEDESWYLFEQKVFGKETCSPWLMGIGMEITKKCLGLPLAIVVTAGLLTKIERSSVSWEEVAKNLSSHILADPKQFMDTLALSYNHLPNHLKTCFLYFGLFGEGHEVPVRNLIWLWVDGGFIRGIGKKCLEDVAEDYLMDLISRSLVIVAKKGFSGEIRTCRMHDLLLDLSLIKAKEENFMQQFYRYPNPYANFERYRGIVSLPSSHICLMPSAPHVHSLQCIVPEGNSNFLFCPTLQLVRMLDLSSIRVDFFPSKILQLVHLRYLALWARDGSLPASISKLRNLQTFIVSSGRNITVPPNFWKIVTLRHLYIKSGINVIEYPCLGDPAIGDDSPSLMADLRTISQVCPSRSCHDVLTKAPNLRELGFCGPLIPESGDLILPDLSNKNHLETLKLLNTRTVHGTASTLCDLDKFPEKLKRLTLSGTNLKWSEMWKLGLLPNLEVLKLKFHACVGPCWETCDGCFLQLKFLKFEDLDIVQWNASDSHFPSLERLVLHSCQKLVGIPSDLADTSTLELIELNWCSPSSTESALEIQRQQESKGNDLLKVHIKPLEQENQES